MRSSSVFASCLLASTAHAWGDVGHRTVGFLAQHYLTPQASQWVNSLLANEDGFDISDAAVWPDEIKRHREYTADWHYLDANDNPPETCGVNYRRDCGEKGCVVSALVNQTSIVLDPSQDPIVQTEALMYIIHFIGDVHQPLHVEKVDRGGNEIHVCFDDRCAKSENLHGIWDTDIVHKINGLKHNEKHNQERDAAQKWADSLFTSDPQSLAGECTDLNDVEKCVLEWAQESNAYVCSYVLANGIDWLENNDLGGEYYDGAAPIVESQIAKAGVRLGAWLNALADAVGGSSENFIIQQDL